MCEKLVFTLDPITDEGRLEFSNSENIFYFTALMVMIFTFRKKSTNSLVPLSIFWHKYLIMWKLENMC